MLFEQQITADLVAEEFLVWDASMNAGLARDELERRGFDIVGVRAGLQSMGYVRRNDLGDGVLGEYLRPLMELSVVTAKTGLRHAVEKVFVE